MRVSNLIEILQKLDPNLIVVLSSDGEGNHFSPVGGFTAQYIYAPETTHHGELFELEDGETLEDFQQINANAEKAVVLYPVS